MRVAIVGAGVAGSYIAGRLIDEGYDVVVYDNARRRGCECAWGVPLREVREIVGDVKVLNEVDRAMVFHEDDEFDLRIKNLAIIDKPDMVRKLYDGKIIKETVKKKPKGYDLYIDASAHNRALLPPPRHAYYLQTMQFMTKANIDNDYIYIHMFNDGYSWMFPVGKMWHVGAGSINTPLPWMIGKLLKKLDIIAVKMCSCLGRNIMLSSPSNAQPVVVGNVYAVGEAAGCITPMGEGIEPALRSAKILTECILQDKLDKYEKLLKKEFDYLDAGFDILQHFLGDKKLNPIRLLSRIKRYRKHKPFGVNWFDVARFALKVIL